MPKKFKLYIPLVTFKGSVRKITFVKVENVSSIKELIPSREEILMNLSVQRERKERGLEYKPLLRKLSIEQFNAFEKEIRKIKSNHIFYRKSFDLVSDNNFDIPLVQITQI